MKLAFATHCAERLIQWLTPSVERIEIAGSIRRERPECGDVDLVITPRVLIERDLLGAEKTTRNLCAEAIYERCHREQWTIEKTGENYLVFAAREIQVDVWFAPADTFGTVWLCRTGSKEHNILLAKRARALGGHWNPHHGVLLGRTHHSARTERDVYTALRLPFIPPTEREGGQVAQLIAAHP